MAIQHRPGRPKPYLARVRINGQEITKGFVRRGDAVRWQADQIAAASSGTWVDPRAGQVRLEDWAVVWMASIDVAAATRFQRESLLRCHIIPRFGSRPLRSLTRVEIETWRTSLVDRGMARSTVRQAVAVLRMALEAAVDSDVLAKNPAARVTVDQDDESAIITKRRYLTPLEVDEVAEEIDPAYRALLMVMALCGLRIGEAVALSPSRVTDGIVVVDRAVSEVAGQTSMGSTKTRKRRIVTMPAKLIEEINRHQALFPSGENGLLFTNRSGNLISRSWFNLRILRPAAERSIGGSLTAHDLRHTNAALLISQGVHAKTIQTRLGHSSIGVTMNTYGHLFPEVEQLAADAIDRAFAGTRRAGHLRVV